MEIADVGNELAISLALVALRIIQNLRDLKQFTNSSIKSDIVAAGW